MSSMITRLSLVLASSLLVLSCSATQQAADTPPAGDKAAATGESGDGAKADAAKTDGAKADGAKPEADKGEVAKADDKELSADEKKAKEKEEKEKKEKEEAQKNWESKTEKLTKTTGLFTIWSDENTILLELDESVLGREFLYGAGLGSGAGSGGVYRGAMTSDSEALLHFERRGEKKVVLVATVSRYAEPGDSLEKRMLDEVTSPSVIKAFDLVAENKDEKRVLVNLGDWLSDDNLNLARGLPGKYSVAKDLGRVVKVANFPRNLEVDQEWQFTGPREAGNLTLADGRGVRVKVHHSLCALPEAATSRARSTSASATSSPSARTCSTSTPSIRCTATSSAGAAEEGPGGRGQRPGASRSSTGSRTRRPRSGVTRAKGIEAWEPAFRKAASATRSSPSRCPRTPTGIRPTSATRSCAGRNDEDVHFAIGPSRVDPAHRRDHRRRHHHAGQLPCDLPRALRTLRRRPGADDQGGTWRRAARSMHRETPRTSTRDTASSRATSWPPAAQAPTLASACGRRASTSERSSRHADRGRGPRGRPHARPAAQLQVLHLAWASTSSRSPASGPAGLVGSVMDYPPSTSRRRASRRASTSRRPSARDRCGDRSTATRGRQQRGRRARGIAARSPQPASTTARTRTCSSAIPTP
jgi:hypothetical protein